MTQLNQDALQEIFDYYATLPDRASQEQIVAMLREVQAALGCVPVGAQQRAAQVAGVKESFVSAIVKRTPSLKTAPFRHCITVCTGQRCSPNGGSALLAALRRALAVDENGLSADGRVLLRTQNCLKQCRTAPNLLVDGAPVAGVSADGVQAFLDGLG